MQGGHLPQINPLKMKTNRLLQLVLFLLATLYVGSLELVAQCTSNNEYGHFMEFDDGSGNENYQNNQSCSWLFESRIGGQINIGFYDFNTEFGYDFIRIYDGLDASAPLIAEFSGEVVPDVTTAPGPHVYIEWTSDVTQTRPGFSGYMESYTAEFNDCSGIISDGAGNYPNNINSNAYSRFSWLINPDGIQDITLDFESFETESFYDWVRVYDGSNDSGFLLGEYSGFDPVIGIVATSGSMFIEMSTDNTNVFEGFVASYSCTFCSGTTILTAPEGTISDGSGNSDYANNTYCRWLIQPEGAGSITIEIEEFSTQATYDYLTIFDVSPGDTTAIAFLNGDSYDGDTFTTSGTALLIFDSDDNTTSEGWTINYTSEVVPPPMLSPSDPIVSEADVLSVYSEAYMTNTVSNFNLNSFAGEAVITEVDIENSGNLTAKIENLDYYGAQWDAENLNGFEYVSFDFYTTNSTAFNFYLIDQTAQIPGGDPLEPHISFGPDGDVEVVQGQWVNVSIPLSLFIDYDSGIYDYDLNDIFQYKFDGNGTLWIDNVIFINVGSLGVKDAKEAGLDAFPNPTLNSWTITSEFLPITQVNIFNVLGQKVYSSTPNSRLTEIDASALEKGLYLTEVTTNRGKTTMKLIKE